MNSNEIYRTEELRLRKSFGDYYYVLDPASRKTLITALVNFEMFKTLDNYKDMEYSGIYILISKAFEIEFSKLFYDRFIEYLDNNGYDVDKYPSYLQYHARNGRTYVVKKDIITLGNYPFILGSERGNRSKEQYTYDKMLVREYLSSIQRKHILKDEAKFCDLLGKITRLISVKRNSSAHRETISFKIIDCVVQSFVLDDRSFLKAIIESYYDAKPFALVEAQ